FPIRRRKSMVRLGQLRAACLTACVVTAMLISSLNNLHAQGQDTKDTGGIDLRFHKFQPPVAPENAVPAAATQAQADALAEQQILALEQDKLARTPAQQKIDSNLLYTARMLSGKAAAPGVASLNTGVDIDDNNNMIVDITANVTDALLQRLHSVGALIWYSNAG